MGKKKKLIPVGVGYYTKDQWTILKSLATDPERLEDTYEEWLKVLEKSIKNFEEGGIAPIPVEIDVLELNTWCMQQNIPLDGQARARFVSYVIKESANKK